MWDYNNDGIIDDRDESDYWDDVYYEEHRGDYSTGLFSGPFKSSSNNSSSMKEPNGAGDIIGSILVGIGFIFVVVLCGFLAFFGLLVCVVFPPLGIIMMIPLYKILGGR